MKNLSKKNLIILAIVAGILFIGIGAVLLFSGNETGNNKKENEKKYKEGELVCDRVITTPEYEMVSHYHIHSDKEGNLTKNEFVSTTTYTTDQEFQRYYSELTEEAKQVYKIDAEKRTIGMESISDYEIGNGIPAIKFDEFKESLIENGFECNKIEIEE